MTYEKELMETFLENASADIPIVMESEGLIVSGNMQKSQVEIFNPLKDFIKLPRAVRRGMDSDSEGFEPIVIDGPVLKVEVIAIYK